jgi:hypothetical protein
MVQAIRITIFAQIFRFLFEMCYHIISRNHITFLTSSFPFPWLQGLRQIIDPLKKFLVLIINLLHCCSQMSGPFYCHNAPPSALYDLKDFIQ